MKSTILVIKLSMSSPPKATLESCLFDENDPELENKFKAYLDNLDNYHYLVDNEFFVEEVEVDDLEGRLNSGLELQLFFSKHQSILDLPYIVCELETIDSPNGEQGVDYVIYSLASVVDEPSFDQKWLSNNSAGRKNILKFLDSSGLAVSDFQEIDRCTALRIG